MIYAIFSRLNRNSFSHYHASLADSYTDGRKKESQTFFLLFLRNSKREERLATGRCMICKVRKHTTVLFTKNKESS